MFFKHIYETGLAQASYLLGCQATGQAIVIDPKRDIDTSAMLFETSTCSFLRAPFICRYSV